MGEGSGPQRRGRRRLWRESDRGMRSRVMLVEERTLTSGVLSKMARSW
jgi:hypothetical protein